MSAPRPGVAIERSLGTVRVSSRVAVTGVGTVVERAAVKVMRHYHPADACGKRVTVVLPAYSAEITLKDLLDELDRSIVDDIVLLGEVSRLERAAATAHAGVGAR
jgi:hypothetical protein